MSGVTLLVHITLLVFSRKEILQDFITLMAIQEGRPKMKEIIIFILVNTTMDLNVSICALFL